MSSGLPRWLANLQGILGVAKPKGMTSYQVVRELKFVLAQHHDREKPSSGRALRSFKIGHGGTLDPLATGVLPIGVGKGTKLLTLFAAAEKEYEFSGELGVTTDSYDLDGSVVNTTDPSSVTLAQLMKALESFHGPIMQTPPSFSAIKVNGKPSYKSARRGKPVELEARPAVIAKLELVYFNPPHFGLRACVSKGTYVRGIVHDLGQMLNVGAVTTNIVRTRHSVFRLEDCLTQEQWDFDTLLRTMRRNRDIFEHHLALLSDRHHRRHHPDHQSDPAAELSPYAPASVYRNHRSRRRDHNHSTTMPLPDSIGASTLDRALHPHEQDVGDDPPAYGAGGSGQGLRQTPYAATAPHAWTVEDEERF